MTSRPVLDYSRARSLSPERASAVRKLVADLERYVGGPLAQARTGAVSAFIDARLSEGYHPNTVRKWLAMIRSYYAWLYELGEVQAEALLAIRSIKPPRGSSGQIRPEPYSRRDIHSLVAALDERWPRLPADDAARASQRWREGKSSYARIRPHGIRLQLNAVIALALECGLRRHEIRGLALDWMHYDNAYVVVWGSGVPWSAGARKVPYTEAARAAVQDWLEFRAILGVSHDHPWVTLWGANRVGQPMKPEAFDKLLRNYVGQGWTLKRLRDTCAVTWARRGLHPEHLRRLLGQSALEDTLPYLRLVGGDLGRQMARLEPAVGVAAAV